jgi:hypothetical protein
VASGSWTSWFSNKQLHHLVTSWSDHMPILLDIEQDRSQRLPKHITRYEIMWEWEASLPEEIQMAWRGGKPVQHLGDIPDKIHGVMRTLKKWSKEKFGAVTQELETLQKRLEELNVQNHDAGNEEIVNMGHRMDELLYREEVMWL